MYRIRTALQQCSNYFPVVGVGVSFAEPSEARLTYFHRAREEKPTTWRRHRRRLGRGNDRVGIVGSSDTPTWAHYRELALPFAITTVFAANRERRRGEGGGGERWKSRREYRIAIGGRRTKKGCAKRGCGEGCAKGDAY